MKLFEPITINTVEISNRIVMPGMETNFSNGGIISQRNLDYYEQRAKGGAGLIIVEAAYFDVAGRGTENMLSIESRKKTSALKKLTTVIHKHGAKTLLQIYHAGIQATSFITGEQIVGPSDIPSKLTGVVPKPLSTKDIKELVKEYAKACLRVKKAGFDGVEIHAGHGYLLNQFFSPLYNNRTDKYGGSLENRTRLAVEVLQAIRAACGPEFVICYRINCKDYIDGGLEVEDMKQIAQILEENGVDMLNITAGIFDSPYYPVVPFMNQPRGVYSDHAAEIKKVLKRTPVCVVGRINTPEIAEEILQKKQLDMVAMGRALIIDPEFPNKIAAGNREDMIVCPACNACLNQILIEEPLKCAMNCNLLGSDESLPKTTTPLKVLIVGAGPAGLEAARISAIRGHTIQIIDKKEQLGGALICASKAPMKKETETIIQYYKHTLNKLGITVKLETPFHEKIISDFKPDVVLLATGSKEPSVSYEGFENVNAYSFGKVFTGTIPEGETIAVIGGGMIGIEMTDFLTNLHNKSVIILEENSVLGSDLYSLVGSEIVQRTHDNPKAKTMVDVEIQRFTGNTIEGTQNGEPFSVAFDDVVLAIEPKPSCDIYNQVKEIVPRTFKIGDCNGTKVRKMLDAIEDGYSLGLTLETAEPINEAELPQGNDLRSTVIRKVKLGYFSLEDIPDFLEVMVDVCNSNKRIQKKSKKAKLNFQFKIPYFQDFWIKISNGKFTWGTGSLESFDVLIEMNKNIAAGIFTGEVNAASAYMSKQLKFEGSMRHGMKFQSWTTAVKKELGLE